MPGPAAVDSSHRLSVELTADPLPSLVEVGAKALSLMRLQQAGLTVPPGFVLTTAFFEPWFQALRSLPAWEAFRAAEQDADLTRAGTVLSTAAASLPLTAGQREVLDRALAAQTPSPSFAVRSSSPEEDLQGASFAGAYVSRLGVRPSQVEQAVRETFASCLTPHVLLYKRRLGFDPHQPRIAVIVQQQIASEVSGVAFSIHPVTGAQHQLVLNASWGLGEAVVSGLCSPDHYVVGKSSRQIIRCEVGAKETALWLAPGGGVEEREDPRHEERVLSDAQALAVVEGVLRIEQSFGHPVDVEWALASDTLYWLQARPITSHRARRT
jgi:phosphoenolpyruvate synthase/pyruvate phosphate dikinase